MNHVFIDYENVQEIDLALPAGVAVSLVLLVGEKQKSLRTDLVEQLLARADNVHLVRMGASGKNALDFTLAYHVGRAMAADPAGYFHIVSKDKGFDALVKHLKAQGHRIGRHDSYADLPFLRPAHSAAKPAGAPSPASPPADKLTEFINNLKRNAANRPKKEKTLRAHLVSHFGGNSGDAEIESKLTELKLRTGITVEPKGTINYGAL